jgi:hypothetical protein
MLTLKQLKNMEPESIFARGEFEDNHIGINISDSNKLLKWVAVRGGIHDWAIYCDSPYSPLFSYESIKELGYKIHNRDFIRRLVDCDIESLEWYRD